MKREQGRLVFPRPASVPPQLCPLAPCSAAASQWWSLWNTSEARGQEPQPELQFSDRKPSTMTPAVWHQLLLMPAEDVPALLGGAPLLQEELTVLTSHLLAAAFQPWTSAWKILNFISENKKTLKKREKINKTLNILSVTWEMFNGISAY